MAVRVRGEGVGLHLGQRVVGRARDRLGGHDRVLGRQLVDGIRKRCLRVRACAPAACTDGRAQARHVVSRFSLPLGSARARLYHAGRRAYVRRTARCRNGAALAWKPSAELTPSSWLSPSSARLLSASAR